MVPCLEGIDIMPKAVTTKMGRSNLKMRNSLSISQYYQQFHVLRGISFHYSQEASVLDRKNRSENFSINDQRLQIVYAVSTSGTASPTVSSGPASFWTKSYPYSSSEASSSALLPNMNGLLPIVVKGISPSARAVLISLATLR